MHPIVFAIPVEQRCVLILEVDERGRVYSLQFRLSREGRSVLILALDESRSRYRICDSGK